MELNLEMMIGKLRFAAQGLEDIAMICAREQNIEETMSWEQKQAIDWVVGEIEKLQKVATVLLPDPYDERQGPYYSSQDVQNLSTLKSGDVLYVVKR